MPVADILKRIMARKKLEVAERQHQRVLTALIEQALAAPAPRGFKKHLNEAIAHGEVAVIAELKKASPSRGVLCKTYDPAAIARAYQQGGATALSVLTDVTFFQGADQHLRTARAACQLPVLRKDFVIDPYQVYESRELGADCILLIVAALDQATLEHLASLAFSLDLDVLVEVHTAAELQRALRLPSSIILGINNRDLHTFKVDLQSTLTLLEYIPPTTLIVTESGIISTADVALMRAHGIQVFLVGEKLMRHDGPQELSIAQLFGARHTKARNPSLAIS